MRQNLDLTHGALFSQRALTLLVEAGMARDDAYRLVQEAAHRAIDEGEPFKAMLAGSLGSVDGAPGGLAAKIDALDWSDYLTHVDDVVGRLETLRS
jgi:adenylosuccinate lyase